MTTNTSVDWDSYDRAAQKKRFAERWCSMMHRLRAIGRVVLGLLISFVLSCWLLSRLTHFSVHMNPPGSWIAAYSDHLGLNMSFSINGRSHNRRPFDVQLARWDETYTSCDWTQIFNHPEPRGNLWATQTVGHPSLVMLRLDRSARSSGPTAIRYRGRIGIRYLLLLSVLFVAWLIVSRLPTAA